MQRLFSAFPGGPPGVALLIMRIALSVLLLDGALRPPGPFTSGVAMLAPWTVAIALWIGLFTPVFSAMCVPLVLAICVNGTGEMDLGPVCTILEAAALAMLGPGAYSLDARLFGRRKIIFPRHHESGDE
ncbi:hypothetical protein LRH25_22925 [Ideonella azotifigens]|uniref:DoxX family protein n=1 Tax=Ideonella azotifigens TaxID=513160 RepID=A0ABN1JWA3_9BURK|nr:hypothetical protein [Ideonella azotifigens]MCD2343183.1 hypothetical protein [Ideonella azotifigens]